MKDVAASPLPGLTAAILGQLMPMFLWLAPDGQIRAAGPTLAKLCGGAVRPGLPFLQVFGLHRPRAVAAAADLACHAGPLSLHLLAAPQTGLRGLAVPLPPGQGVLLNLSFGIWVGRAVRDHALTGRDFAPTDLTVELLYLQEAKTAVTEELRNLNQRLQGAKSAAEEQALTDTLTGLRNRRAMDRMLSQAAEAGIPFGLMHLDLDHFKQVNDTLGHAAGDHVLDRVGQILRAETRATDTVARVGGDEFVLLFPGLADSGRLEAIGQRIIARLETPILYQGQVCRVSASIGTTVSTLYPLPAPERVLNDADRALYASKRKGRARVTTFSAALDEEYSSTLAH